MQTLAKSLHFSDVDLAHNREGRQSSRQRRRNLWRAVWGAPFWFVLTVCLFTPMMLAFSLPPSFARWGLAAILFFLGFSLSLDAYRNWRHAWKDWQSGVATQITGALQKSSRSRAGNAQRHSSTRYTVQIDKTKFMVSNKTYHALERGQRYTLYYLPHRKKILSVEVT